MSWEITQSLLIAGAVVAGIALVVWIVVAGLSEIIESSARTRGLVRAMRARPPLSDEDVQARLGGDVSLRAVEAVRTILGEVADLTPPQRVYAEDVVLGEEFLVLFDMDVLWEARRVLRRLGLVNWRSPLPAHLDEDLASATTVGDWIRLFSQLLHDREAPRP